jgi:4-hydroxy-tetrahydrodipicolinate synthase
MQLTEIRARVESVVAIPVTPFDDRDGVDEKSYGELITRLVDGGVEVITPNGNTSEFYALTPQEAQRCVEITAARAGDALVMAGVGLDTASAVRAAEHARDAGARLVMVHQPVHPFRSADGWLAYHRVIADAVPDLGVVLYLRDPAVPGALLARLFDVCPNVVAIKYAVPDPVTLATLIRTTGVDRMSWLCGLAETWAPFFWLAGVRGFTSGLVNVAPQLSLELLGHLRRGDHAAAMGLWWRLKPFEDLRARDRSALNVSVVKEALAQLGLCTAAVRPPISTLSAGDAAVVRRTLEEWGMSPAEAEAGAPAASA